MLNAKKMMIPMATIMTLMLVGLFGTGCKEMNSEKGDTLPKQTIKITKVYDIACPWCYVGKKRLYGAIAQRPDIDFEIEWQPFQLNPTMPREGRNRWDYYRTKFGPERARGILAKHKSVGVAEGITFCSEPETDAMAPNTLSAHTLMYWAGQDASVDTSAVAEKLYHAHHVACENVGDHDVLVRIAGEVGMDQASVAQKLADGSDEEIVKQRIDKAREQGINGVPFFIVNDELKVSGAQPVEQLLEIFERVLKER